MSTLNTPTVPTPNTNVAVAFLRGLDPKGRHDLVAINPYLEEGHPDKIEAATFLADEHDKMRVWINARQGRKNLYTSVNRARDDAPRNKRLSAENIGMIRAIVADIDPSKIKGGDASGTNYRAERVRLQSVVDLVAGDPTCPPSMIVDTGGGIQLWWEFDPLVPVASDVVALVEGIGRTIQQRNNGDGVWDLPRIMRLPGTINILSPDKRAQGRTPETAKVLIEQSSGKQFSLDSLKAWAPPSPKKGKAAGATDASYPKIDMAVVRSANGCDDLPKELQTKFEAECACDAVLKALWEGDPASWQTDTSGSGYVNALAWILKGTGTFTPTQFGQLVWVWPKASDRSKIDARYIGKTWAQATPAVQTASGFEDLAPSDLWAERFTPADLPVGVVPDAIECVARDQARRLGVEAGAPAAALVTAIGSLVPAGNQMQMRQNDTDWKVKPILWTALIGEVGKNKSATLKYATDPVSRIESKWAKRYATEKREYDRLNPAKHKAHAKDTKVEAPEPPLQNVIEDWPDTPSEPVMKRKVVQDVTTEEVSAILSQNEDGLLYKLDELSAFFGGMDAYRAKAGKDRSFWLQAKEGAATTIDRRSHGVLRVENTAVSVLGGIQPSKIRAMGAGLAEDGMLQRFLPIILKRYGDGEDVAPNKAYADVLEHNATALVDSERCGVFKFTPEGDDERRLLEAFKQAEINRPGATPALREWLDKTPNEFGRLSLVFHFIEWHASPESLCGDTPPEFVSGATARRARRFLMEFVYSHARVFHQSVLGRSQFEDHIAWIGGYILAHGLSVITPRDIYKNYAPFKPPETHHALRNILQALEAEGWLSPRPGSQRFGHPTSWAVNPAVHSLFAAKAAEERQARLARQNSIRAEGAARRGAAASDPETTGAPGWNAQVSPTVSDLM
jgi:hypothetical protein